MEKLRYEIDPFNRLVVTGGGRGLPRQRTVLDGVFKADKSNNLTYHVKSPSGKGAAAPHQLKLKGSWALTKEHNLTFTLDKWRRSRRTDSLTLSGDIIDVKQDAILFSVTARQSDVRQATYVIELSGAWRSDKNNRLTFRVKRENGASDTLTFEAGWEVARNNEILYRYEKSDLLRKTKTLHTLIFKGRWRLGGRSILSYALDGSPSSAFNFRTSLGMCGDDYIKHELGIILSARQRPARRTVTLFGAWNIGKGTGLFFEVESADGDTYPITLGGQAALTEADNISLKLKDPLSRKDLGLQLELSHALLEGDGAAFLQFLKSKGETAVFVGAGFRW